MNSNRLIVSLLTPTTAAARADRSRSKRKIDLDGRRLRKSKSVFFDGTETVTIHATDSAAGVSVENACRRVDQSRASQLGTLNVETRTIAIELDEADLGGVVPSPGSKIVRTTPTTNWRIISTPVFDHVHRGLSLPLLGVEMTPDKGHPIRSRSRNLGAVDLTRPRLRRSFAPRSGRTSRINRP